MNLNALLLGEVAKNVDMVDEVFWFTTWISIACLVGITVVLLYFMVKYRRRGEEIGADIHGSTSLEVTWTLIPLAIVMVMFWFGWKGFDDLRAQPEGALEIPVKGGQWNWNYSYERVVEKDKEGRPVTIEKWTVRDSNQKAVPHREDVRTAHVASGTKTTLTSPYLVVSRFKREMEQNEAGEDVEWNGLVPFNMTRDEFQALSKEQQDTTRKAEQDRILSLTLEGHVNALLPTPVESDGPRWLVFLDGPNSGERRAISSYDRKTGSIGWEEPLEQAPLGPDPDKGRLGDRFEIRGRLVRSILYVPAETDVILRLSSSDVLHSYYIPDFRTKEDTVPGLDTFVSFHALEPGLYPVFCAEYCGAPPEPDKVAVKLERGKLVPEWIGHHNMLSSVWVVTPKQYDQWIAGEGQLPMESIIGGTDSASMHRGDPGLSILQKKQCLSCHTLDSSEDYAPSFVGMFGKKTTVISDGKKRELDIDAAYIRKSIEDPAADIVEDFEDRRMKMFPMEISDEELTRVVRYLKGLE